MSGGSAIIDIDSRGLSSTTLFDESPERPGPFYSSDQQQRHDDQCTTTTETFTGELLGNAKQSMGHTVSNMMWEAGKTHAKNAWSIYGNIDLLRPYFDVEPGDVLKRILNSLIPKPPTSSNPTKIVKELYGPTMLTLTLIAFLLFEMKNSGHSVKEGTLIGTAFGTCFGYWIGCGTLAWLVSYVCNTHATYLQIISMIGYSLSAHCIVVLLSTLIHTAHDHMFFYVLWGIFGGLSTLRMMSILISRTHGPSQKLVICSVVAFLNLAFLLYLHFAYHQVVEEFDDLIQDNLLKDHPLSKPAGVDEKATVVKSG